MSENKTASPADISFSVPSLKMYFDFPRAMERLFVAVADSDPAALAAGATALTPPKTVDIPTAKPVPMSIRIAFVKGPDGEEVEFFTEL